MFEHDPTNRDLLSQVLSDRQQQLYGALKEKDELLAQMYFGAIWVLRDTENPVRVQQAAYSMREMMNKLSHIDVERTGSGVASQFIKKQQHSASLYPKQWHSELLRKWSDAYGFFNGVLHLGKVVSHDEFVEVLHDAERLLLDLFIPKPTEDFDSLDALTREGEDDADN